MLSWYSKKTLQNLLLNLSLFDCSLGAARNSILFPAMTFSDDFCRPPFITKKSFLLTMIEFRKYADDCRENAVEVYCNHAHHRFCQILCVSFHFKEVMAFLLEME